jgi:hypothetical protein
VFAFAGCKQAWAAFAIGRPLRHADFDGWLARVSTAFAKRSLKRQALARGATAISQPSDHHRVARVVMVSQQ